MDVCHILCMAMVLLATVMETESCMCAGHSLRTFFCEADFAVKAFASNWTAEGEISTFTLHILKVFKMPVQYQNETEIEVTSLASDGMCGINPGRPNPYMQEDQPVRTSPIFITGSMTENGELWTRLCSHVYRTWRHLSDTEKGQIKKLKNLTCSRVSQQSRDSNIEEVNVV